MTPTSLRQRPRASERSPRATQIVEIALALLESEGREALTMRRLAAELGVQAPSLYKHFANKAALERALIEVGLATAGEALHAAARRPGRRGPVGALLHAYRRVGITHPNLYRLLTDTPFERNALAPGLEEWSGEPFFLVTGEPHRAQSLWAFAHGMLILEINERFPPGSLDRTWAEGARAFASRRTTPRRI